MGRAILNSFSSATAIIPVLMNEFKVNKYLRLTWTTKRDRTLDQNALWASMYQRISQTLGDGSILDVEAIRAECKLNYGVPILYRDCEQFKAGWDDLLACKTYEEQLRLMGSCGLFGKDGFPVTRLFDTKQGAEYTETLLRVFIPQGVYFEDFLTAK